MSRLSEAQLRMLERMATGGEVWTLRGLNSHAFWQGGLGATRRSPRIDSVEALERAGFVEEYERDWGGEKYRITEAGRLALTPKDTP